MLFLNHRSGVSRGGEVPGTVTERFVGLRPDLLWKLSRRPCLEGAAALQSFALELALFSPVTDAGLGVATRCPVFPPWCVVAGQERAAVGVSERLPAYSLGQAMACLHVILLLLKMFSAFPFSFHSPASKGA